MIPAILMVVGTAISAYSSIRQGQVTKSIADYNAKVQKENAEAKMASIRAQREAEIEKMRKEASTRRVNMAGQNILGGSPLAVHLREVQGDALDILEL